MLVSGFSPEGPTDDQQVTPQRVRAIHINLHINQLCSIQEEAFYVIAY
jgi:hypothetical protein